MFLIDELEELPVWLQVVGWEDCGGKFFDEGKAFNGGSMLGISLKWEADRACIQSVNRWTNPF